MLNSIKCCCLPRYELPLARISFKLGREVMMLFIQNQLNILCPPGQPTYTDMDLGALEFFSWQKKRHNLWWQSHFEKLTLVNLSDLALRGTAMLSPQTTSAQQCLASDFLAHVEDLSWLFFFSFSFPQWTVLSSYLVFPLSEQISAICLEMSFSLCPLLKSKKQQ